MIAQHKPLWDLTRGQRLRYGAAIAGIGLATALQFGVPWMAKDAIDSALDEGPPAAGTWLGRLALSLRGSTEPEAVLFSAAVAIVALTALAGLFTYLRGRWAAVASEAIVRRLRRRLYAHLERLPCTYHDRAETGDLVQRCTSDVDTVRAFLSQQIVEIGRVALLLLIVVPILFRLDPRMALASLVLFPVIVTFAIVFFGRVKASFLAMDEAEGRMTSCLQENLTGIRVVRAFARHEHEEARFADRNGEFRDKSFRLMRLLGRYWASSDVLCLGQMGIVVIFGGYLHSRGELSVGTLYAFITYESLVIWPVRHLGRVLSEAGKAVVSLGRLGEILAIEPEPDRLVPDEARERGAGAPASVPSDVDGALEVSNLTFVYPGSPTGDAPVLTDVSFSVAPGETLAILGPPGSGKSTLVHLLLRLYDYDPARGSIRLDGRELAELDRRTVRAAQSAVLQEPFLYSKSLGDNVRLGRGESAEDELVRATRDACVHDAIEAFPDGYDTLVGERGVTLSGGQRQRVALARALLRDTPVLLLDDALSAVDTDTEERILGALRERRGRRTTIVVAHRLSTVEHADKILVLEEGRVVQSGTHADLIDTEGPYRRLWSIQGALEDEIHDDLIGAAREPVGETVTEKEPA